MATKNDPGPHDCYDAAKPNEPMFILLARDRHAAGLVRLWALLRAKDGEDPEKVHEALECATTMDIYLATLKGIMPEDAAEPFNPLYEQITTGMHEHPDGWENACNCDTCQQYAREDSEC